VIIGAIRDTTRGEDPVEAAAAGRRELLISKVWLQAVVLVVVLGFFTLGLLAYRNYTQHPPVPEEVVGPAGEVLFTGSDISRGQQAFLNHGLMEYGSVFGHGAYLGPSSVHAPGFPAQFD
jgi:nitric oxide reductase subunit B